MNCKYKIWILKNEKHEFIEETRNISKLVKDIEWKIDKILDVIKKI